MGFLADTWQMEFKHVKTGESFIALIKLRGNTNSLPVFQTLSQVMDASLFLITQQTQCPPSTALLKTRLVTLDLFLFLISRISGALHPLKSYYDQTSHKRDIN